MRLDFTGTWLAMKVIDRPRPKLWSRNPSSASLTNAVFWLNPVQIVSRSRLP